MQKIKKETCHIGAPNSRELPYIPLEMLHDVTVKCFDPPFGGTTWNKSPLHWPRISWNYPKGLKCVVKCTETYINLARAVASKVISPMYYNDIVSWHPNVWQVTEVSKELHGTCAPQHTGSFVHCESLASSRHSNNHHLAVRAKSFAEASLSRSTKHQLLYQEASC